MRKLILAIAVGAAGLFAAGCAVYPDDAPYAYGPNIYVAPGHYHHGHYHARGWDHHHHHF